MNFGPAYSSDNAGDGPEVTNIGASRKRKRLSGTIASRGNHYIPEAAERKSELEKRREEIKRQRSFDETLKILNAQKKCCSKGHCFLKHFQSGGDRIQEWSQALSAFKNYRDENSLTLKSNEERPGSILNLFLQVMDFNEQTGKFMKKTNCKLDVGDRSIKVCPRVYHEAHGITNYEWKQASKTSKNKVVSAKIKLKAFKDKQVPPFNYRTAKEIFREHVPDFVEDMRYLHIF